MSLPTLLVIEDDDFQYEIYEEELSTACRLIRAILPQEASRCADPATDCLCMPANNRTTSRRRRAPF